MKHTLLLALCLAALPCVSACASQTEAPRAAAVSGELLRLETRHATLQVDGKGFVVSLKATATGKEYVPAGHPSPLLALHEGGAVNDALLEPVSAKFRSGSIELAYANGAVATVEVAQKKGYFRFRLASLANRGKVDNVVWGPLKTNISGKIGDIIGVVRSKDFAIGMMGVDDNTIAGPLTEGDSYGMGYYIHSEDPEKDPLPANLKDGQWLNIGGDGVNDVAFYSHPEPFYHQVFGTGAKLEPGIGSSIAYHARDRRKSYTYTYSLLPGFKNTHPRKVVSDPLPGVDFIGSTVALYACPDDLGLSVLETIHKDEGMPFVTDQDGRWIRNPASIRPTLYWNGPVEKAVEYATAMGFRRISRDTGEFYPSRTNKWVGHVPLAGGKSLTYAEFGEECRKGGINHGGLHTLVLFLQGGVSNDVTPVPSARLQAVCRTTLAKDISPTDTEIVVTDPSFLAEKGTWHRDDNSNYLRIGGEMLRYDGISDKAPWTLKGVTRGHASRAQAHKAGDEVAKLMQNCYNGFVPDMSLVLDYADYYADLMARNKMADIGFDGYESLVYQHQGAYAFKKFNGRLFDSYRKLTGRFPEITCTSNIFDGAWNYIAACNVGGGGNMFHIPEGRWATEGKDIGTAFANSYFPPTFGGQGWNRNWTLPDAENLMAKAVGWNATFGLNVDQADLDATPIRDEIFKAWNAWQQARELQLFTKAQLEKLRDPALKFHLERTGDKAFVLHTLKKGGGYAESEKVGK